MPRRSSSKCASASALVLALGALLVTGHAHAQPCCGGSAALTPGRLEPHEDALIGVIARARELVGSWDQGRAFSASAPGTFELDFEQDLVAAVRVARRVQVGALVPVLETWRRSPGAAAAGGFLGDVDLSARWDFVRDGDSRWPGLALLGGVLLPTGRPPESATAELGVDASGAGSVQLSLGLAAERSFGNVVAQLTGSGTWFSPRSVNGISSQRSVELTALAAVGYVVGHGAAIGLHASYAADFGTSYGAITGDSARAATKIGATASITLRTAWRLQSITQTDLPISTLGKNESVGFGGSLGLARTF